MSSGTRSDGKFVRYSRIDSRLLYSQIEILPRIDSGFPLASLETHQLSLNIVGTWLLRSAELALTMATCLALSCVSISWSWI